jgi:serine/threonine protein kinase/WD40 repeat protein
MAQPSMPPSENHDPETPHTPVCIVCGGALGSDRLEAQCPRCLLNLASSFGLPGEDGLEGGLPEPQQARSFGDYELLEEIARGGMGVVYRARQISLNRDVAIKMILAGELADLTALRMFEIEAHAAANLHHPNIVPVYEIGASETQHYFTMRYVPGGQTIANWAATRRSEPHGRGPGGGQERGEYRAIATAAAKVARAVAYAHMHSVLHRDLKPSNILWDAEAGPQITDFGLAKLLDSSDSGMTRSVQAMGSPSYMAPEQMDCGAGQITTVTDVYGIGAVLYELLAGRPPFVGASALETMRRAAEEAPPPIEGVPKDLRTICLKCLAKAQEDRYASAAELAEDLERFARGEPVSVVPLTPIQSAWRWSKRQPKAAALVTLFLAWLLAGMTGIIWQWRKAERARAEQAKTVAHLRWEEMGRWQEEGDPARALVFLASLIRERPDRWEASMYAMSIVDQSSFPVLAGPEIHPPAELVGQVCFAADGSWMAGAGKDRVVRVWETASGKETAQIPQVSPVSALAASAGPAALAIATRDGALTLGAAIDAAPTPLARASSAPIEELSFSANGSRILARVKDHLEIWECAAPGTSGPSPLKPPLAVSLSSGIKGASLSADGARAFAWSENEAVVWDTASGGEILRARPARRFIAGALAAGGARVALLDGEKSAIVWDIASRQPFPAIASPLFPRTRITLDFAGNRLTLSGFSNDLVVFDVKSGLPVSPPMKHQYVVLGLWTSADGTRTASYGLDDMVRVWDSQTGRSVMTGIPLGGLIRQSEEVHLSRDGRLVLEHTAPRKGAVESLSVWRATRTSKPQRRAIEGQSPIISARLSPDGRIGCVGLPSGNRFQVFEIDTGRVLLDRAIEGHAYAHLITPDSRRYYVMTDTGWLHGWSLETGEELWKPNHQPGAVRPAALSPDGTRIIAGHNDGHIRIYDTATGKLVQTLDHPGEIKVLRFAPDGSGRFVSGSTDQLAHVWDLRTGRMLQTFTGHADTVISAAWSPDGRLVATASYDRTARVWDMATGKPLGAPMQHTISLSHLEFSPDGALLATACRDQTARLWHPLTGLPASPPLPQQSSCQTVRFTADGAAFIVRDSDGFRFWDTSTGEAITVHYPEPEINGLGVDAECYRALMSGDGSRVFLARQMNDSALWSIPQPRGRAPAWFPDFLEMLAQARLNARGEILFVDPGQLSQLEERIGKDQKGDIYGEWARRVLGR